MPDPQNRMRVLAALQEVRGLAQADRLTLAEFDLPLYELLVIAHLRAARSLLGRDASFSVLERGEVWSAWYTGMASALDGALRYHENEPLVIAIGVVSALLPGIYPRASLRGFKALEDAVSEAQRSMTAFHRQRSRYRPRMKDIIVRTSLWISPTGRLYSRPVLSDAERAALTEQDYREVWGVVLTYHRPESVAEVVSAVLPVVWVIAEGKLIVAPVEQSQNAG